MIEGTDILEKYCNEKKVDMDKIDNHTWQEMAKYVDMMLDSSMDDINQFIYDKFKEEAWLALHNNDIEVKV